MSIYLGSSEPSKIYVGSNEVAAVYVGDKQVRPAYKNPDITSAVYEKSITVTQTSRELQGLYFSNDGLNMYYSDYGRANENPRIISYSLSTAWDIGTAVINKQTNFGPYVSGVSISNDGRYLFIGDNSNSRISKYTLSTPYDISTGTLTENLSTTGVNLTGLCFNSDGTKLYYMDYNSNIIVEYSLPTAWTLTGATLVGSKAYPVSGTVYRDCAYIYPGNKMYLVRQASTSYIYQIDMTTKDNVTTATYNNKNISVNYNACGIYVNEEGTKMFVGGISNKTIYQYSLS